MAQLTEETVVRPVSYALTFAIDPEQEEFAAEATLSVELDRRVPGFRLDARALSIERAWESQDGEERDVAVASVDDESIELSSPDGFQPGLRRITVSYRGRLATDAGLLRVGAVGQRAVAALFAPVDARRAFPCFDNVRWRVPFTVTVTAPERYRVFANSDEASATTANGWTTHVFHETPPLPTYLVALTVGDFTVTAASGSPRTRVVAARGGLNVGDTADMAERVLQWFETFLGEPYPFGTLTHVAVPEFPGGTESFACISYNDRTLLGSGQNPEEAQRDAVSLVSHEVSHMWFGGWVSPDRWGSVWMSEAVATALEHMALADLMPGVDAWAPLNAGRARTLMLDALPSARAVEADPVGRRAVEGMLDGFTYVKGSGIVRMLFSYLGPARFRAAIREYLRRGKYVSASSDELLDAVSVASGVGVAEMFAKWIREPGHTRVRVDRSEGWVSVALDPAWPVQRPTPVRVSMRTAHTSVTRTLILDGLPVKFRAPRGATIVVNPDAIGFYRTTYVAGLPSMATLRGAEQAAHLDDLWDALLRCEVPVSDLTRWVSAGRGHLAPPAREALLRIARLSKRLLPPSEWAEVADAVRAAIPVPDLRGAWSETDLAIYTEVLGDADLGRQAFRMLVDSTGDTARFGQLARAAIVATTSPDAWNLVASRPRTVATMVALGLSDDPRSTVDALDRCLAPGVGADELPFALEGIFEASPNPRVVWEWVARNWDQVRVRISKYYLPRTVRGLVECGDADLAAAIDAWLTDGASGVPDATVSQLREQLAEFVRASSRLNATERQALSS